ncbi:hypothetical protein BMF89_01655 [Arthrobacter sp. SRS-W-1-2016]|jgi:hypothetical protein|uniref:hypothetical protein n=1 Tax=Arthrobacter TaxID=1663 RepID=UPI0009914F27|nr:MULTISPECIES: hypothetical protein [Arthrobacter]MDQ0212407.1 hypothetical protein [Arthrobacter bambusae]MDQ0236855.1 hypothetical protein [Arthrobacter bambusae]OOP64868.1 hypothetical protein BMF89_01655 [Arthrobacter sp. SRS-W-1-2016]
MANNKNPSLNDRELYEALGTVGGHGANADDYECAGPELKARAKKLGLQRRHVKEQGRGGLIRWIRPKGVVVDFRADRCQTQAVLS